jgi:hypothetical protein
MSAPPGEEFVSEPITPVPGSAAPAAMSRGEPGLPMRFTWRDRERTVECVLARWKSSGPGKGGMEVYLRRHWFRVRVDSGEVLTLYCQRQAPRRQSKQRWWVYTIERPGG